MHNLATYELMVLATGAMVLGLYLLIKGGDWTVDAASFIAEKAGLSKLFIGATIVAFGTSVPELFTSVNANLSGFPGISLGNVLGSNIANILLVIGATAIVFHLQGSPKELRNDLALFGVATILLLIGSLAGIFPRWAGGLMFALLVSFVAYQYFTDKGEQSHPDMTEGTIEAAEEELDKVDAEFSHSGQALLVLLGGFAALMAGSEFLVNGAVAAGNALGVPEAVIGLTVVAFGTSLPELSTCVAAALKRHTNMIIGNIIGSGTFNILSIVALTALIKPLPVDTSLTGFSLWATVAISFGFIAWMMTVSRISRATGIAMVAAYVGFIFFQYQTVLIG